MIRNDMIYIHHTLQSLAAGGFLYLGRCVPSVCSEDDVFKGWTNFFIDFLQTSHDYIDTISNGTVNASIPFPYSFYPPMNCHTADEESKVSSFFWNEKNNFCLSSHTGKRRQSNDCSHCNFWNFPVDWYHC